jgi:hypothetical protein
MPCSCSVFRISSFRPSASVAFTTSLWKLTVVSGTDRLSGCSFLKSPTPPIP